ncbi:cobalt-zinc-cadmium resistance protein CzcA [Dyadobacter jejuensis]|uniref:Cobalt-zinc-cadmium resistance protein CzcA n=1 Tax=Dyadobacter jejuensis TaxID=1082580 RepID=A0A316AED9_9BACT|nr:CusA/CzcA family heavy metal efflux RND transporter [Dyadobacter jejuensis]PWJ55972.1 cobalt-zinc-cadmium resistance protein CzcA [Dyadobacter jejuensis]
MLKSIIEFAVKSKLIIGLFVLGLIAYGSYELQHLPIDAVPDITDNQVQVITIAPSYGATDIERLVTFPIEQANSNIAGIKEIRSFSRFGLSLVTIVFTDDTDVYWARQQVSERLQKVQTEIPKGIGIPELGPISTGLGEIYQYVVRPKKGYEHRYDETELRTIQDWIVRRQLLGVKGVAEVSSFGGKLKQYAIEVNPNKLMAYGVTIDEVFTALDNNNQNTGGAYIEKGPTVLFIRTEGLVADIEDINNIPLKQLSDGQPLFVRDVAQVTQSYATRYGALCYNDEGEVSGAVVMMLKGANSSEVIVNVKDRIAEIQKTLPEGVVIEPFLDRSKMVNNAIGTVEKNLMEGALIVVFVLVLFLGNLRAGLLVASVIPLSMLFAVIMMNLFGVSGNLMSLGALDFGLIVDGAVIIVESVMHHMAHHVKIEGSDRVSQQEMNEEVKTTAGRMMNSAVFGQIIILIVYLPIFTLQGIEGKMFKPMAQTVAFALLGAFILSLTYIPMMSALVLSKKIKTAPNLSDRWMDRLARRYQRLLLRALGLPKTIVAGSLALFTFSLFVLSTLGGEFIPALEEGDFAVDTRVLTGSNLQTSIDFTQKAAHILKSQFPEVEKVVTKIGSGEVPTDPMPMEASDLMVILKDKSEWTSATTFPELSEKMGAALKAVPGITTGFQFPVQMRFNELMTGARQDVVCKIFGEDLDTLSKYAQELGVLVNQVEGAKDLYVEAVAGVDQITIVYNRPLMAQYGLHIADVNRVVHTAFAGQSSGQVFEGEKRFDLMVRLGASSKRNLEDIRNVLIPTASGNQIPLSQVAAVTIGQGPNQIQREDAKRRIVVGFNISGRDVQSVVADLKQLAEQRMQLPSGYYLTYGGAFENLNAATQRLMIAVPISLLLIFVLLFFAFGSLKDSLLIYTAIPLSAMGGILALALRQMPFSISAGIGFIALFGVAVLNGIVLVAEFNRLRKQGELSLVDCVVEGAQLRLRPVLMTAFVASLGFLPMALSNGAGAEVQRPLATVVIGGLLVATFLTLFVLPILYIFFAGGFSKPKGASAGLAVVWVLLSFGLLAPSAASAQSDSLSLSEAIRVAQQNNLDMAVDKQRVDYQKALVGTARTLPQTNVLTEVGQINSIYMDTRFAVGQSFSLPGVYRKRRAWLHQELLASSAQVKVKARELSRQVSSVYVLLGYQYQRKQLIERMQERYENFLIRAQARLSVGESEGIEVYTAELQLQRLQNLLVELEADQKMALMQLQYLLQSPRTVFPKLGEYVDIVPVGDAGGSGIDDHPQLAYWRQRVAVADAAIGVEKSQLLPELNLSYANMSMRGMGADDRTYTPSKRFQAVQLGVGIPIFQGGQKAKIASAVLAKEVAAKEQEAEEARFSKEYALATATYAKYQKMVQGYESGALQKAGAILASAHQKLETGNINLMEWTLLTNQSVEVEQAYLEAVFNLNHAAIALNYYLEQ